MQWTNTAAVRPNNAIAGQRTNSMPQLINEQKEQANVDGRNHLSHVGHMQQGSNSNYPLI